MRDHLGNTRTTPDPLAEQHPWESPYQFCGNNPVNRIDPTGLDWYAYSKGVSWFENMHTHEGFTYNNENYKWIGEEVNVVNTAGDRFFGDMYGNLTRIIDIPEITVTPDGNYFNYLTGGGGGSGVAEERDGGGGANVWDYVSNGASIASGYPTISGTWAYNNSRGDVRWTGKNGNYYKLSQVKNNGGYVKSMNYAKNASRLTRGLGNGLTGLSVFTSGVSTYLTVSNGTDNTSTWVNLGVSVGGAFLTVFGAPVVVTSAAIGGAVWGIGQLVAGDKINGWIDNNFGYK